jgi:hypothetical protein
VRLAVDPRAIRRWALAVWGLALIVRLAHLWAFRASPFYLLPPLDGEVYLATARAPIEGVYFQSPGYVNFLKGVLWVWEGPLGFRLVQCVLGASTAALTTLIATRVVRDRRWAIAAGMAIALCGPLVAVDAWPALESPNVLAHAAACVALLAAADLAPGARGRLLALTLAGLALGAAILLRPSSLLFLPVVAIYLWMSDERPRRARVGASLLPVGVALLVMSPVTLHNLAAGDRVLVTASGGLNLYLGNGAGAVGLYRIPATLPGAGNAFAMAEVSQAVAERAEGRKLKPSEISNYFTRRTIADIRHDPRAWLAVMGKKLLLAVNWFEAPCSEDYYLERSMSWPLALALVTFGILAPLFAIGALVACLRDPRRRDRLFVLACALLPMATTVMYFYLGRYRLPSLPAVAALAALGAESLMEAIRAGRRRSVAGFIALMIAMAAIVHLPLVDFDRSQEYTKLGTAAARLGRNAEAATALDKALEINPGNLTALHNLAAVREAEGRRDEARELWSRLGKLAGAAGDRRQSEAAERAAARLK